MDEKRAKNGFLLTLSGAYPTREAYESGLLLPARRQSARPAHQPRAAEAGPSSTGTESGVSSPGESPGASGRAGAFACEFRDYCNRLYSVGCTCDCATGWKRRAGIALPASP